MSYVRRRKRGGRQCVKLADRRITPFQVDVPVVEHGLLTVLFDDRFNEAETLLVVAKDDDLLVSTRGRAEEVVDEPVPKGRASRRPHATDAIPIPDPVKGRLKLVRIGQAEQAERTVEEVAHGRFDSVEVRQPTVSRR